MVEQSLQIRAQTGISMSFAEWRFLELKQYGGEMSPPALDHENTKVRKPRKEIGNEILISLTTFLGVCFFLAFVLSCFRDYVFRSIPMITIAPSRICPGASYNRPSSPRTAGNSGTSAIAARHCANPIRRSSGLRMGRPPDCGITLRFGRKTDTPVIVDRDRTLTLPARRSLASLCARGALCVSKEKNAASAEDKG